MITKYSCGSRDTEQFFWQWQFFLVCMWFCQLSMYLQTTDTTGPNDSVSQWHGEPTTCWLPETDDYDERIRMTDGFFMQQNLKQWRTHPSSVSLWQTNTNDERHLRQQNISYWGIGGILSLCNRCELLMRGNHITKERWWPPWKYSSDPSAPT